MYPPSSSWSRTGSEDIKTVGVGVGVLVGVPVAVDVGVGESVDVAVLVGVKLGESVGVWVTVGNNVGVDVLIVVGVAAGVIRDTEAVWLQATRYKAMITRVIECFNVSTPYCIFSIFWGKRGLRCCIASLSKAVGFDKLNQLCHNLLRRYSVFVKTNAKASGVALNSKSFPNLDKPEKIRHEWHDFHE